MRKIYSLLIGACILLGTVNAHGQDKLAKKVFRKGKRHYKRNDYIRAEPFLKEAHNLDPENAEYAWMLGHAVYMGDNPAGSLPYLVAAFNLDQSINDEIEYYLARSMHLNMLFDEALTHYNSELSRIDQEEAPDKYRDTEMRIQQCKNAPKIVDKPVHYKIENLGEFVNSHYPEYAATFAENYSYMIYTSRRPRFARERAGRRHHVEDINEEVYEAHDHNGVWMRSRLFVRPIPKWRHDASISLSEDGKTMIYYVDARNYGDVYVSKNVDGKWTKRESIGENINTKDFNEPSVFISDAGQTLYWVSDKPDGKGMKDIYVSKMQDDGTWGEGESIGDHINTEYDEDSPFISEDGKRFYFSSRGLNSMGGYDIFYCDRLPDGSWGEPKNMGYPINSVGDDIYFVTHEGTEGFFFTSERPGGYGEKDIYRAEPLPPSEIPNTTIIAGTVTDKETGKPVESLVSLIEKETEEVLGTANTDTKNGDYEFVIPDCGEEYRIDVVVEQEGGPAPAKTGKYNVVSGTITDAVSEKPLDAVVELIDLSTNDVVDQMPTNPETGNYMMPVESGKKYMLRVKSNEYLPYYEEFNVAPSGEITTHYEDISLQRQTDANKLVITWQFFDHDRFVIKKDYYQDLENVVTVLNKVPEIKLNVIGHTDADGTEPYNQRLSENRAQQVAKYLTDRGIDPNRLNISGMGEAVPIYPNDREEFKKWNRRVELYIIE